MTNREKEWEVFSQKVLEHIKKYTVAQYGDSPNDLASNYTKEKCAEEILKYITRHFRGMRGKKDTERDLFKICHYACMLFWKER